MFGIFPRYRFTHPKTEQNVFIGRWSYLWAGLFGAIYVAWKGMGSKFLHALAVNVGFAVLVLGTTAATSMTRFVTTRMWAGAVAGMVVAVIAVQGTTMVNIIRDGYRRRGWRVRANE